jgi:hypothetical protein
VIATFQLRAEQFLRSHFRDLVSSWLSADVEGAWHPNGFAVFHLRAEPDLGDLRLHVWPTARRVALEGQPAIHSHPWDLCSLVLVGRYDDILYDANEVAPGEVSPLRRVQRFELELGAPGRGDRVYPVDRWYVPAVRERRAIEAGEVHYLPAGQLHQATVPTAAFVSTLLLTSAPRKAVQLLGDGSFGDRTYVRPPVSASDLAEMKVRLSEAVR